MRKSLNKDSTSPVSADDFENLMFVFGPPFPPRLALAISGGPDSMALAFCTVRWAHHHRIELRAFIVDHSLRAESANEARVTQSRLAQLGILADILLWEHGPISSRLHQKARDARYKLLSEACRQHGFQHLLVAHQREDQAETILMRLAKGSGIEGLSGMQAISHRDQIFIWRPFLPLAKSRLLTTCQTASLDFVTDPSNMADKFARGRLRRILPLLQPEGLTVERLLDLGARAASAEQALHYYKRRFLEEAVSMDESGTLRINTPSFQALPPAVADRVLSFCLRTIHPSNYPPEHLSLSQLRKKLQEQEAVSICTLQGCLISLNTQNIVITREYQSIQPQSLSPGQALVWDGRWQVQLASGAPSGLLKPLGTPCHEKLDLLAPGLRKRFHQGRSRAALPSLWQEDRLIAIADVYQSTQTPLLSAQLIEKWPPPIMGN